MNKPDISAVPNWDSDCYLFAGISTQTNGVEFTVLSLLARRGANPSIEAGRLARWPNGPATDWLAEQFTTMPLSASALGAGRTTASRSPATLV